ncbi:MAG: nickel-dependent lactate racemase [Victivallaceae bacterium]|nr:nickel-dependent lactate racemase [Victivallaceae bacterium]
MTKISVPYAHTYLEAEIPERNFRGIFAPKHLRDYAGMTQSELVRRALANPIASPRLEELVKDKKNMVIITSDHTRPVPSKVIMPEILAAARTGNPDIDVTILVATGFHRATTREELINKLGTDIVDNERIIVHDSQDKSSLVQLAPLPSGGELWVNKLAVETDLLIAEGFIEPHFFAGFSGGRKSVLPGVAGAQTVLANHCAEFIASPHARTGALENNPVHRDMLFAAGEAKLAFIVNVIIDEKKNVVKAFAGDFRQAHEAGCAFLEGQVRIEVPLSDIVITSNGGYPLDQNIYQAVKGMTAAEAAVQKGGVIIMVAACNDGHGGQSFFDNMANSHCPGEVLAKALKVPRNKTVPDQWEFQILARVLKHCAVIMVSDMCPPEMIKAMHMKHAFTLDEAIAEALRLKGENAGIAVIPDGVSVIVKGRSRECSLHRDR